MLPSHFNAIFFFAADRSDRASEWSLPEVRDPWRFALNCPSLTGLWVVYDDGLRLDCSRLYRRCRTIEADEWNLTATIMIRSIIPADVREWEAVGISIYWLDGRGIRAVRSSESLDRCQSRVLLNEIEISVDWIPRSLSFHLPVILLTRSTCESVLAISGEKSATK